MGNDAEAFASKRQSTGKYKLDKKADDLSKNLKI